MKKKILSLLVLLVAAVTGAWATDAVPAYNLSVAESDNGSGTISYTVQDKDDAEKITENAKGANEGDKVTVAIAPDEGWVVDVDNVKAEVYRYWEGSRRAQATVPMQRTVDLDYKGKDANGVATYTFVMPASNVKVKGAYKKLSTLYFDPADKTNLMEVKVDGIVRNVEDSKTVKIEKVEKVTEGTEITLTANTGYKFRKVEVKKKAEAKPLANATTEDLGKVVGADGKIYATKADAEAVATGNAVAMICYVNEGHGLALALSDISSHYHSWDNSGSYNEGKTAAELCSAWNTSKAVTGATWKLASKSEMNLMINAAGNYAALRDGFSAVGGTNMIDEYYWLSDESTADYAKNINFSYDDGWSQEFKYDNEKVRACLEW